MQFIKRFSQNNNTARFKHILVDVFEGDTKQNQYVPKHHKIKKHHWFLGSLVILTGSWITHTTTATIYEADITEYQRNVTNEKLGFALMNTDPLTEINIESHQVLENNALEPVHFASIPTLSLPKDIEPALTETVHTVKKGETLGLIFKKHSLDLALPHRISVHEDAKQLVSLSIGKDLTFRSDESGELKEISYPINSLQEFVVKFKGNIVDSTSVNDIEYEIEQHHVSAEIKTSLYDAALDAGLTINLVMELVRIFGWDVDFAQDIRSGDSFHVIYDDYRLDGEKLSDGDILAAQFTTQGYTYQAIRFEDDQGYVSYYTPEGESMLGTFLRSPVEFSRISSGFGNRKHPILKTWRAHKGVDYAASTGTPILATADGKVIHAGNNGGYGRTVILRHAGRFTTLYGHMNGLAKGIRSGVSVKQGDVIGYVGSTGLATGPHLHYEFRVDGVHKNPLTYKTPKASAIEKSSVAAFNQVSENFLAKLNSISDNYQLAKAKSDSTTSQL